MSRPDPGIARLHSRHHLADDGTPAMTPRFEQFIDGRRVAPVQAGDALGGPPTLPPLSFAEAWARLRAEEPHRAAAVVTTVIHKLTVRDAAPVLNCSSATVSRRKGEGLAALAVWTAQDVAIVARQVCELAA